MILPVGLYGSETWSLTKKKRGRDRGMSRQSSGEDISAQEDGSNSRLQKTAQ